MDPCIPTHQDGPPTPTSSLGDRQLHPKYRGVRKRKWGKWVSEIRLPNCRERIWLGSYDTPEKAARAFDAAQYCLRGRNTQFNFPDNPPDIPVSPSLSPREIQAVAARFANEHEQGEGLMAAQHDVAEGGASSEEGAGSSKFGNMGWPFLDKWFDDDRIYGGMGYAGMSELQYSDHGMNMPLEENKNSGGGYERFEDEDLHGPSFLWNF